MAPLMMPNSFAQLSPAIQTNLTEWNRTVEILRQRLATIDGELKDVLTKSKCDYTISALHCTVKQLSMEYASLDAKLSCVNLREVAVAEAEVLEERRAAEVTTLKENCTELENKLRELASRHEAEDCLNTELRRIKGVIQGSDTTAQALCELSADFSEKINIVHREVEESGLLRVELGKSVKQAAELRRELDLANAMIMTKNEAAQLASHLVIGLRKKETQNTDEIAILNSRLDTRSRSLVTAESEIRRIWLGLENANRQLAASTAGYENSQLRLGEARRQLDAATTGNEMMRLELDKSSKLNETLTSTHDKMRFDLGIANGQLNDLQEESATLKFRLGEATRKSDACNEKLTGTQKTLTEYIVEQERLKARNEALLTQKNALEKAKDDSVAREEALGSRVSELENDKVGLQQLLDTANREKTDCMNRARSSNDELTLVSEGKVRIEARHAALVAFVDTVALRVGMAQGSVSLDLHQPTKESEILRLIDQLMLAHHHTPHSMLAYGNPTPLTLEGRKRQRLDDAFDSPSQHRHIFAPQTPVNQRSLTYASESRSIIDWNPPASFEPLNQVRPARGPASFQHLNQVSPVRGPTRMEPLNQVSPARGQPPVLVEWTAVYREFSGTLSLLTPDSCSRNDLLVALRMLAAFYQTEPRMHERIQRYLYNSVWQTPIVHCLRKTIMNDTPMRNSMSPACECLANQVNICMRITVKRHMNEGQRVYFQLVRLPE